MEAFFKTTFFFSFVHSVQPVQTNQIEIKKQKPFISFFFRAQLVRGLVDFLWWAVMEAFFKAFFEFCSLCPAGSNKSNRNKKTENKKNPGKSPQKPGNPDLGESGTRVLFASPNPTRESRRAGGGVVD